MTMSATVNAEEIAQSWYERGYRCELWEDRPGHQWADRVHDTDEIFMVVEGDLELEMNGEKLRPQPGEELMIPARTHHTIRNVGETRTRWLRGECLDFAQTD